MTNPYPTPSVSRLTSSFAAALLALAFTASGQAQIFPKPVTSAQLATPVSQATGLMVSKVGTGYSRGSGAIARNGKLIYSCGHMIAANGVWASELYFLPAYNASAFPALSQMKPVRGYKSYSEYRGPGGNLEFSRDFIVAYDAATAFGTPLETYADGASLLLSSTTSKLIAGYPAKIDYTGASGATFQYYTGSFTGAMSTVLPTYLTIVGVSTGGGNSGGPVFVSDNGTQKIAGVLISGATNAAGVYALTPVAETMAQSAMAAIGVTGAPAPSGPPSSPTPPAPSAPSTPPAPPAPPAPVQSVTLSTSSSFTLRDNTTAYSLINLPVTSLSGTVKSVTFSLNITAKAAGDLDVFLRSPNGRVSVLSSKNSKLKKSNLVITNASLTSTFAGSECNGVWGLFMRDAIKGNACKFNSTALTITRL